MRLNRGTLGLILASIVVIAAVLLLNNQPASAPGGTPTATGVAGSGPLFPDIADVNNQGKIVRFEVVDVAFSSKVVMTKDEAGVWTVSEATNTQTLATDQTKAVGTMSVLASLSAVDRFETDKLADFGLDAPKYTLLLTDSDGKTYGVKVGNKAAANPRYYVLVNDDVKNVYVVPKDLVDGLIGQIANPAYVASPTPTASPTSTPNPYSEVEQTATAAVELQNLFATLTATAQATAEATADSTSEATAEATGEVTVEAAPSATPVPPTATKPPATRTPLPPTATKTATKVPPTATKVSPTATPA